MNDYKNFCEYSVRPEPDGRTRTLKLLLMLAYTLITAGYIFLFWVILRAWQLLILLPFIMYALIILTWRFVRVEYEYAIEAGVLTVAKIFDGRSRRVKLKIELPECTLIAPRAESGGRALEARDIASVRDFSASPGSADAWVLVCPDRSGGKKSAAIIETNAEMRRILRLCNPSAYSDR